LDTDNNILFEEHQQFRQLWVWLIVLAISLFLTYGLIQQLFYDITFGSQPMSNTVFVIVWLIFGMGFPLGFYVSGLTTRVYHDRLSIKLFPLHLTARTFPLNQIKEVQPQTYRPILDYGGWGIRYSRKGKAYNISGKQGVKIYFQNGRPLLIGSQKPTELANHLKKAQRQSS